VCYVFFSPLMELKKERERERWKEREKGERGDNKK
jgi:hypothetical protein